MFAAAQLLPGDVGRTILGPLADQGSVAALNHKLGTDQPVLTQYWNWISNFVQGDFGTSLLLNMPVRPAVIAALENSLKLALVAFVIVVPHQHPGRRGSCASATTSRPTGSSRSVGLSLSAMPEFVSGVVLILIFTHLARLAAARLSTVPPGSSVFAVYGHLFLPALPLVFVLFGYIARIARAGTIEALDADYTRTAYLKGLTRKVVIRRARPAQLAAADDHGRGDAGRAT